MQIPAPMIDSDIPLTYRVKITGHNIVAPAGGFVTLGAATRYVRKIVFAGQLHHNIWIDEYYGTTPTGVFYRYNPQTLTLIKDTK